MKKERISKFLARTGIGSRREIEKMIAMGRITLNDTTLRTPCINVGKESSILIDGHPIQKAERTRVWLYHKPRGLITSNKDPKGRQNIFDNLPSSLPRVVTVGRLDINSEGLMLLTNDGGLARILELPRTNLQRIYRVRTFGKINKTALENLSKGIVIDDIRYAPIQAIVEHQRNANSWLRVSLHEGKNLEIKRVLWSCGLKVNRLIRISFGPFLLADLMAGETREINYHAVKKYLQNQSNYGETISSCGFEKSTNKRRATIASLPKSWRNKGTTKLKAAHNPHLVTTRRGTRSIRSYTQ